MSCVTVDPPLRRLLHTLTENHEQLTDRLDPDTLSVALSYGWVYEHAGRVALTGAGHHHTERERKRGMLE